MSKKKRNWKKKENNLNYIIDNRSKRIKMLDVSYFSTVEKIIDELKEDHNCVGYQLELSDACHFNKQGSFKCIIE
tara:strand:+ start:574 stop:798 length:225 start_codon:yes stop_codon:yes gene_type:complete